MTKKITIGFLVFLILAIIAFMVYDLFYSEINHENTNSFIKDTSNVSDSALIAYKEVFVIKPKMDQITSIAIDKSDNIIISGSELAIYKPDFTEKQSIPFQELSTCVTVNSEGDIFIGIANRIEIWTPQLQLKRKWETKNKDSFLTGIAVSDSSVFVADATERLVYRYHYSGKLLYSLGAEDSIKGVPAIIIRSSFFDISMGRDNEIWVVNPGNYSIEAFDHTGNLKSMWGEYSESITGFCGCCNPTHLAILSDGSFVTSEKACTRVKIYSPSGELVSVVANSDSFDEATKGLDLAVDSKNRIYVLDPVRKQVRIFEKK